MGFWMKADSALLRLVEDNDAPIMSRVKALKQVKHPPLTLLRRLLVDPATPRDKPVPGKLKAVATLKYAQEMQLRQIRKKAKETAAPNALGIV